MKDKWVAINNNNNNNNGYLLHPIYPMSTPIPYYAGELREAPRINDDTSKVKRVPELPESLSNVRPAHISKNPTPPKRVSLTLSSPNSIQSHLKGRTCLVGTSVPKGSSIIVIIFTSVHSVRWGGEGVKGDRRLF